MHAAGSLAVVSASGGLDSTALLVHLLAHGSAVRAIAFDYGQTHRVELERLQANVAYLREQCGPRIDLAIINLRELGGLLRSALTTPGISMPLGHYAESSMRGTFVPNRNAIFSSIVYGVGLSLAQELNTTVRWGLGVHAGDHAIYPDCRPEFYERLWAAFQAGNWDSERVQLYLPYLHWNKADILADCRRGCDQLRIDFATVCRNTCTSYLPDAAGRAHGLTGADVERILAFDQLGWCDPLDYGRPWPEVVAAARAVEQNFRAGRAMEPPPRA